MILETNTNRFGLEKKKRTRKRTSTKKIQNKDEVTVTDKGLYVPYEQNFVTKTMFYFCPREQCINNLPHWTNLKPPYRIRADSSFTDDTAAACKDNGLPICNSVDLSN